MRPSLLRRLAFALGLAFTLLQIVSSAAAQTNPQIVAGKTGTFPGSLYGTFGSNPFNWIISNSGGGHVAQYYYGQPVPGSTPGWFADLAAGPAISITAPLSGVGTNYSAELEGPGYYLVGPFDVVPPKGSKKTRKSGRGGPNDPQTPCLCNGGGGDGGLSASINANTGNALIEMFDPVATRGYPLVCNVSLSSQTVETGRPMGNATFTDDIHVTTGTVYDQNGNGSAHWILVDGDGTRLDFGPASSAPTASPGVFSVLATLPGGGYTVTAAGGPEAIDEAGNFSYLFNSGGQLTQITDAAGNVQTLTYAGGLPTQVTDQSTGKALTFGYTGSLMTQVSEGGGAETTALTYSGGDLTSIAIKDGGGNTLKTVQYSYDPTTGLLSSVERDGDANSTINFHYDYMPDADPSDTTGVPMANYATSYAASDIDWGDALDGGAADTVLQTFSAGPATTVRYDHDASGNLSQSVTPAFAGATQALTENFGYNAAQQVISASDGFLTELYGYTANGLLSSDTDGLNNVWSWTYNGTDLTSAQDPVQAAAGVSATLAYTDPAQPHVPTDATDASGNAWSFGHNAHGQITSVTPPADSPTGVSTRTYDEVTGSATLGYLLSETDGNGDRATYDSYDALGDVLQVSTYPVTGNTTPKNTTQFAYDGAQRLTQVTRPDGKTFQYAYVGKNLDHTVDEAGTQYAYTYCASCGLMTGITGPTVNGQVWSLGWDYDADHNLAAFSDARGYITTYAYGNAQELTGVTYPDGSGLGYLYNDQGLVRQVTNGRGDQIALAYDGDERLQAVTFPTTGQPSITVTYDAAGRVQSFTDGAGTTTYAYQLNGWVQSVRYDYGASGLANAQELDYTYSPDGLRHTLTWKNGAATVGAWAYAYDAGGRLTGLTNPWGEATGWAYDGEGKLLSQTNANGTSAHYTYDPQRGWPTALNYTGYNGVAGSPVLACALTYDNGNDTVGHLTGLAETFLGQSAYASTTAYGYDALSRLTSEARTSWVPGSHAYGYDPAGNRTGLDGASAAFDAANKCLNSGYSYDGDGDLLTDGATAYAWDDRGDLTSRSVNGTTLAYGYDARGLRVMSRLNGGAATFYVFDGETLLGEVSASGSVSAGYTWGADGLVSDRLVPSGRSVWPAWGPQGEAAFVTDGAGGPADAYYYAGSGAAAAVGDNGDALPLRFGGQFGYYTDPSLPNGAVLCGHRWYDPNNGRWLSRDPSGYKGGINLYGYCANDPVNRCDPRGLWSITVGCSLTGVLGLPLGLGGSLSGGIVIGDGGIGLYGSALGGLGIGLVGSAGINVGYSSAPQPSGWHGGPIYGGGITGDLGGGGSLSFSSPFPGSDGPSGISGWKGGPGVGGGIGIYGGVGAGGTGVLPIQWPNPFQGSPGLPGGPSLPPAPGSLPSGGTFGPSHFSL